MQCSRRFGFLWRIHLWSGWSLRSDDGYFQTKHCTRCGLVVGRYL